MVVRAQPSPWGWTLFVALFVLGFFTIGITWAVLAWILRSMPSRIDADGVHFLLRRTYSPSEIDEVRDITFVSSRGPVGRGLGLRFQDGVEVAVRSEYLGNVEELRAALGALRALPR